MLGQRLIPVFVLLLEDAPQLGVPKQRNVGQRHGAVSGQSSQAHHHTIIIATTHGPQRIIIGASATPTSTTQTHTDNRRSPQRPSHHLNIATVATHLSRRDADRPSKVALRWRFASSTISRLWRSISATWALLSSVTYAQHAGHQRARTKRGAR